VGRESAREGERERERESEEIEIEGKCHCSLKWKKFEKKWFEGIYALRFIYMCKRYRVFVR
jgi:hypothetical protein